MSMITPIKRRSTLDTVTEPNILATYLCGYSLRTCALFILWTNIIFMITFFVMVIIGSTYIHIYWVTVHAKNDTKYTFLLNNEQLLSIDISHRALNRTEIEFSQIGKRILELVLSTYFGNILLMLSGLVAVYNSAYKLIIPYMVVLVMNVLWFTLLVFLDLIFIACQFIKPFWWLLVVFLTCLVVESYKLMVIFAYYHLYRAYSKEQMKTPPCLTTERPLELPITSVSQSFAYNKVAKLEGSVVKEPLKTSKSP